MAKKISGSQNERVAKIGVLDDTVKGGEEIRRIVNTQYRSTRRIAQVTGARPRACEVVAVRCPLKHAPFDGSRADRHWFGINSNTLAPQFYPCREGAIGNNGSSETHPIPGRPEPSGELLLRIAFNRHDPPW